MDKVILTAWGLVCCSVCAKKDLAPEDVARETNAINPTGISSRWSISDDKTFADGKPMPCPCEMEPDARQHWLLTC